ncbi:MAG: SsrA-binding protein SmpB [Kiritimatiellaeota bacterium]|nr:SsrA-binding protein SmpB [Kiritimatiellota bacterium]
MGATLASNRKVRHEYAILDKFEAGIVLTGTEVKSCRARNIAFGDGYARVRNNELWLIGVHIAEYNQGNRANHNPTRDRKLLLHRREIMRLRQAVDAKGLTLVPLRFYLSPRNLVKVELGLCRGKNIRDKRQSLRKKTHDREAARAIAARKT